MNIDDELLAQANLIAGQNDRSLGSVLNDALEAWISRSTYELPRLDFSRAGLQPGVDLREAAKH